MSPAMAIEANTFSIVARCPRSGALGVAVASAVPAVGSICPYIRPGIGVVSTQSWVNPYLAIDILAALESGVSAKAALASALAGDTDRDQRQLGVVDAAGEPASWTGAECTSWAGEVLGSGVAVQGNMLVGPDTLTAMEVAFLSKADAALSERLMSALEAGDIAGGDKRGKQSAALKVFEVDDYPMVDLRVDESDEPIVELRRVFAIARAQLSPFIAGMPSRDDRPPLSQAVKEMLLLPPRLRPGSG
jgi:uncharacterized Ntn-hydrolase superfamily protein